MFKASGATEAISNFVEPLTSLLGFPKECVSLALIRPISGSGALSVFESILSQNSPDGFIGRVASVLRWPGPPIRSPRIPARSWSFTSYNFV